MADAGQVAEGFFDAWTGKDFQRARGLLHDDVSFEGPSDDDLPHGRVPAAGAARSRRCSEPSPAAELPGDEMEGRPRHRPGDHMR